MSSGIAATLLVLGAAPATAQEFTPGRPGDTDSPIAVAPGRFQIETELAGAAFNRGDDSFSVADTLLRYGLGSGFDIEIGLPPLLFDGPTAGHGDTTLRITKTLAGLSGGPAFGLIGTMTLPTANNGLGSGKVDVSLTATGTADIAEDWDITATGTVGTWHNSGDSGTLVSGGMALGRAITEATGAYVELFAERAAHETAASFNFGFTHLVNSEAQLDIEANLGITGPADDLRVAIGFAHRF